MSVITYSQQKQLVIGILSVLENKKYIFFAIATFTIHEQTGMVPKTFCHQSKNLTFIILVSNVQNFPAISETNKK